jgi:KaiC/GvpD/RAD55 family RecA-like ATPase
MNRVKTGVPGLDKLIEGGFPEASSILFVGPPGCGKSTLSQQFIAEGLKSDQPGLYITLDISPQEVLSTMGNFGWKTKTERLKFIDAYSWRVGKTTGENVLTNLGNINDLNIAITEAMKKLNSSKVKRNVFDSLSTLLLYADPSLVVKFIPVIIAKAKNEGFVQILILEEGVHDQKTVNTLNYVTDGVIEFKMEEDKRFLRVVRMKATKQKGEWTRFDITNKGIRM